MIHLGLTGTGFLLAELTSGKLKSLDEDLQKALKSVMPYHLNFSYAQSFKQPSQESIILSLLKDVVKPAVSAQKHAHLTDSGTKRIRPLEQRQIDDIAPPTEVITILKWVSLHIEVCGSSKLADF